MRKVFFLPWIKWRMCVALISLLIAYLFLTYLMVDEMLVNDIDIVDILEEPVKSKTNQVPIIVEKKIMKSEVMKKRMMVMEKACSDHNLDKSGNDDLHRPNPWEYFINTDNSLVWCNVFKSASTSWMYIFNQLAGYSPEYLKKTKQIPLTLARKKYPRPSLEQFQKVLNMENATSIIIGRNPFERLVSAYKDKIVGALPKSFHDKMRREITSKYRKLEVSKKERKLLPHLIPTFKEFVQYIVDEDRSGKSPEMHWAPVYKFCIPCQVHLNSIALMETLDEDTTYILTKTGLENKIGSLEKKNTAKDGKSATVVMNKYLVSLGEDLYEKLLKIYRIDFDIFGYTVEPYQGLIKL